jgi:hypothetical protein
LHDNKNRKQEMSDKVVVWVKLEGQGDDQAHEFRISAGESTSALMDVLYDSPKGGQVRSLVQILTSQIASNRVQVVPNATYEVVLRFVAAQTGTFTALSLVSDFCLEEVRVLKRKMMRGAREGEAESRGVPEKATREGRRENKKGIQRVPKEESNGGSQNKNENLTKFCLKKEMYATIKSGNGFIFEHSISENCVS